ncbi:hypothetical protein HBI76_045890 [Parastagonospora nodorum]|nr:hypothetical protein HBI76_045890 [Parastagonospora nodorum]
MCYLMPRSPTLLAIPSLSLSAQSSPCPCRSQDPSPASNVNVARASPIWEPLMSREQLYHHTVLPRDVPGREDRNLYCAESELATRLTDAVKSLVPHAPLDDLPCIDAVRLALTTCGSINVDGKMERSIRPYSLRHYNRQNEATGAISLSPWRDQRRSSTRTYRAYRSYPPSPHGATNAAPLHGHTEPIGAIHPLLHGLTDSDDGRVRVQVFSRILL